MSQEWATALDRVLQNNIPTFDTILKNYPYLEDYARRLRQIKSSVLDRLDYYVDTTIESVKRSGGSAHFAKNAGEAKLIVREICAGKDSILFAKSNVVHEVGLREFLEKEGHEVWETDLGEFLVQLAHERSAHIIMPAIHLTKERIGKLLHDTLDPTISPDSSYEEMVGSVRKFLFQKYSNAQVGITGANAIAADTGSVVLVENEGNIRMDTVMPRKHIVVTGVDKIVPTLEDAFLEAQVQSAFAGLYPPTYINVTSGPSSTGDIESKKVSPATGPQEFHVVLVDNGRTKANADPEIRDALLCIKCGRCYFSCPVYRAIGKEWVPPPYGGPMGAMWSVIVNNDTRPATLCTHSGGCKEVCPVKIDIPRILERIKFAQSKK